MKTLCMYLLPKINVSFSFVFHKCFCNLIRTFLGGVSVDPELLKWTVRPHPLPVLALTYFWVTPDPDTSFCSTVSIYVQL